MPIAIRCRKAQQCECGLDCYLRDAGAKARANSTASRRVADDRDRERLTYGATGGNAPEAELASARKADARGSSHFRKRRLT